jgi:molecular chaperone DnaK
VIGIDFGTTNSRVSVMDDMTPKIMKDSMGHSTTPSIAAFTDVGECLVGWPAKRQGPSNPKRTFFVSGG